MANLEGALQQLRDERRQAEQQVETLDKAISAIEGIVGGVRPGRRRGGRVVSAEARRKMADAQKARWARFRQQRGSSAKSRTVGKKRVLSAAARKKIADAQRARWARFRSKQAKAA